MEKEISAGVPPYTILLGDSAPVVNTCTHGAMEATMLLEADDGTSESAAAAAASASCRLSSDGEMVTTALAHDGNGGANDGSNNGGGVGLIHNAMAERLTSLDLAMAPHLERLARLAANIGGDGGAPADADGAHPESAIETPSPPAAASLSRCLAHPPPQQVNGYGKWIR